jgi:hypothetical protein
LRKDPIHRCDGISRREVGGAALLFAVPGQNENRPRTDLLSTFDINRFVSNKKRA